MGDGQTINVNSGALATIAGLLKKPAVIWVLALVGWWWGFSQWRAREGFIRARLEAASKNAEKAIAKENAAISSAARARLEADRRKAGRRRATMQAATRTLRRYEGKTDAVVPADVHGAIQEVR